MARITRLIDDLDGTEDSVHTRSFALGNTRYSIDLSDKNYDALTRLLEPYVNAGSVVSGGAAGAEAVGGVRPSGRQAVRRPAQGSVSPVYGDGKAIKVFAESIGAKVPYARPPYELVRQWIAAHPAETRAWEERTGLVALEHYA